MSLLSGHYSLIIYTYIEAVCWLQYVLSELRARKNLFVKPILQFRPDL